jgi:hypothetical protein
MPSFGTLRRVVLVGDDVSEERISIIMETRIGEALTRATRRNIPKDGIFRTHLQKNHKSYIAITDWAL